MGLITNFRFPTGVDKQLESHIKGRYTSKNAFIIEAIKTQIERDLKREKLIK